jgi:hypothetical protein
MKTTTLCVLTLAALTGACASDSSEPSVASGDELSAQVAFYGLTVVDCQQQATQCYQSQPRGCSSKLARCLGRAGAEAAKGVLAETKDVTACGKSGVQCLDDATKLSAVLKCEDKVESCVLTSVQDLTGIPLPTSQQAVAHVAAHVGEVAEVAVQTAGTVVAATTEVVETAVETTGQVIETGVKVTGEVAEHAVEHVGEVIETAHEVTAEVAQTATGVVSDVVDTGVAVGKSALQCGEESRTCLKTTGKLLSCQRAYVECLATAL